MKPAIWHTCTLSQLWDRFRLQSWHLNHPDCYIQSKLGSMLFWDMLLGFFFPMKKKKIKKIRIWWEEEEEACGLHLDIESGCRRDRHFQTSSWSSGNTQVVININKTILTSEISSYNISYLPSSMKILVSILTSTVLICLNLFLMSLITCLGTDTERVALDH